MKVRNKINKTGDEMKILNIKDIILDTITKRPHIIPLFEGFIPSMKMNSISFDNSNKLFHISLGPKNEFLNEESNSEYSKEYPGGIITFSKDINSQEQLLQQSDIFSEGGVVTVSFDWDMLYQDMLEIMETFKVVIDEIRDNSKKTYGITNISMGNYFKGNYVYNSKQVYDEISMSIELNGIEEDELNEIARALCIELNIETVMVKNHFNSATYLISNV